MFSTLQCVPNCSQTIVCSLKTGLSCFQWILQPHTTHFLSGLRMQSGLVVVVYYLNDMGVWALDYKITGQLEWRSIDDNHSRRKVTLQQNCAVNLAAMQELRRIRIIIIIKCGFILPMPMLLMAKNTM